MFTITFKQGIYVGNAVILGILIVFVDNVPRISAFGSVKFNRRLVPKAPSLRIIPTRAFASRFAATFTASVVRNGVRRFTT